MEKKVVTKEKKEVVKKEKERYTETVGRRKTSVVRVRLYQTKEKHGGKYDVVVNDVPFTKYFPIEKQRKTVVSPFMKTEEMYRVTAYAKGGGIFSQAEALRLGITRALVSLHPDTRSKLKALGYLKRDPRMVERKKFGSRKARRPQQWRKR